MYWHKPGRADDITGNAANSVLADSVWPLQVTRLTQESQQAHCTAATMATNDFSMMTSQVDMIADYQLRGSTAMSQPLQTDLCSCTVANGRGLERRHSGRQAHLEVGGRRVQSVGPCGEGGRCAPSPLVVQRQLHQRREVLHGSSLM